MSAAGGESGSTQPAPEVVPRPMIERLGLGLIALLLAAMFGALGYVSLTGGEVFLGIMGVIGALMTVWAAGSSLRRG